jgi:hypothetical protein
MGQLIADGKENDMKVSQVWYTRTLQSRYLALIAPLLGAGWYPGFRCGGDSWFRISVPAESHLEVNIWFAHALGDLDLFLYLPTGGLISKSDTMGNHEIVISPRAAGTYSLNVHGYNGAQNIYSMKVEFLRDA